MVLGAIARPCCVLRWTVLGASLHRAGASANRAGSCEEIGRMDSRHFVRAIVLLAGTFAGMAAGAVRGQETARTVADQVYSDAQAARERGQCKTAANIYEQFINDVNAQTGKSISVATASRLVSEAQFLIANCP